MYEPLILASKHMRGQAIRESRNDTVALARYGVILGLEDCQTTFEDCW